MTEKQKRRGASISQYEPLVTPQKWTGDEQRFAQRLTQLMDQLFEKQSSLQRRLTALEKQLEKEKANG